MGNRCIGPIVLVLLILVLEIHGCFSLNSEGLLLLRFRADVAFDPSGALNNWNPNDCDPCSWSGVGCLDSEVVMLNLTGCYLEGVLPPELGNLSQLRVLDLSKNHFSRNLPPQIGGLSKLEVLDLRDNDLSGTIPPELGGLKSLRCLLLRNNRFQGQVPLEIEKLSLLVTDVEFCDTTTSVAAGNGCVNRKFGHCIWQGVLDKSAKSGSFQVSNKWSIIQHIVKLPYFKIGKVYSENHADGSCSNPTGVKKVTSKLVTNVRRVLSEQSSNFIALPPNGGAQPPSRNDAPLPSRSSGSFSAVPNGNRLSPSPISSPPSSVDPTPSPGEINVKPSHENSDRWTKIVIWILSSVFLLIIVVVLIFVCRSRAVRTTIGPWKSSLSGQLQKAFVTGVPKLNREELETACEDFSNIICVYDGVATLYKGTLSSGVEITVASTAIDSQEKWSKRSELAFRKKIDSMSRVNHKNFVNLIGYCEEEKPFTRMMVFEYAPNGSLFEHLHVKELEHLDWNSRMRIVMGTAYCLQYMHELNPPVVHTNLTTKEIFLTDDYAAKIGDAAFWRELVAKSKNLSENESSSEHSELPQVADVETNIHGFGMLLLEIVSGMLPYTEENGSLGKWASQYLNDKSGISNLTDPTLKSVKENELEIVCEVIQSCIQQEAKKRPAMKEVIQKLRQAIDISPEAAIPRLSPLWWAELEILSSEAA